MYIPIPSHYYLFSENLSISSVLSSAVARESLIICTVTAFRLQSIPLMWPQSLKVWKTSMPCPVMWLRRRAWVLDTQPLVWMDTPLQPKCDLECLGKKTQISSYSNVPDCRARGKPQRKAQWSQWIGAAEIKVQGSRSSWNVKSTVPERREQLEKGYRCLHRGSLESAPKEYTAYTSVKMHMARHRKTGSCLLNNFQLSHSVGRSSMSDELKWKDLNEDLVHVVQIPEMSHLSIELK